MSFQTEFQQMSPCAWAFEPLKRRHGHPWAWGTSQNTHGHSWECLELGECPLLGSPGKQCISHNFGLTLHSTRDPEGNTYYKTVHSLYLLSHTSTLCCFPFSWEKSIHFPASSSSPDPNTSVVAQNINKSSSCFQKLWNLNPLTWSVSTWTKCKVSFLTCTGQAAASHPQGAENC